VTNKEKLLFVKEVTMKVFDILVAIANFIVRIDRAFNRGHYSY
jgi:hypothetical protein